MNHLYFSQRAGSHPNPDGLCFTDVVDLFKRVYMQLAGEGYFTEAFGFECVDAGWVEGVIRDVELEVLLAVRKNHLWPIATKAACYNEDDLFDVIEFLYQHVSKPIDGTLHNWNHCGMHWTAFNKAEGQKEYRDKINRVLSHYIGKFEVSSRGEVLLKAELGFDRIFAADVPTSDTKVGDRIDAAALRFRRHGSTFDDRRQAVRDLADVLEYLRPQVKNLLSSSDESDLFNIANNFGIRHHNERQKTGYDAQLWLPWMFYFYLSTIHVLLRKIERAGRDARSMAMPKKALERGKKRGE
jgi:hypothetical protein